MIRKYELKNRLKIKNLKVELGVAKNKIKVLQEINSYKIIENFNQRKDYEEILSKLTVYKTVAFLSISANVFYAFF